MSPSRARWLIARWTSVAMLALLAAASARAALDLPVDVRLSAPGGVPGDPTPIDLTESIGSFTGIAAGGSGSIASFMLPGERIFLDQNSIFLRVAAGSDLGSVLTTGFLGLGSTPASYRFSGLNIAGEIITGLNVFAFDGFGTSGSSGVESGTTFASLVDPSTVQFNLSSLVFLPRPGLGTSEAYGEFRIDLITTPVPEPGTLALFAAALATLWGAGRQRRRAAGHQSTSG